MWLEFFPAALAIDLYQSTKDGIGKMGGSGYGCGLFQFQKQTLTRLDGHVWIKVQGTGPFWMINLHDTMNNIPKDQDTLIPSLYDEGGMSGCIAGRGHTPG